MRRSPIIAFVCGTACSGQLSFAQCQPHWIGGDGITGGTSRINDLAIWDPDGSGPVGPTVVAAGTFTISGVACGVAMWDGVEWRPLGISTTARALAVLPTGELIAVGGLGTINTIQLGRWNGNNWQSFAPTGSSAYVRDLAATRNGGLVVGGNFTSIGTIQANNIALWDGAAWHALGSGLNAMPWCVAVLENDDVVAGGYFTTAGGQPSNYIARWDGIAWHSFGSGLSNGTSWTVGSILPRPGGGFFAAGAFTTAQTVPVNFIAQWDGANWSSLAGGTNGNVSSIVLTPDGLVAGGQFTMAGSVPVTNIARWDGAIWHPLDAGIPSPSEIDCIAYHPSGEVIVGGVFSVAGGQVSTNWARWTDHTDPWIAHQPSDPGHVSAGAQVRFTVVAAAGYGPLGYSWRRDNAPLTDGPTPNGSLIAGSNTPTLLITNAQPADSGSIDCAVSNACGSTATTAVPLDVRPCYANCDQSTSPPLLNVNDFICFQSKFAAGDTYANCDASTVPPVLNVNDFICFISYFANGCD